MKFKIIGAAVLGLAIAGSGLVWADSHERGPQKPPLKPSDEETQGIMQNQAAKAREQGIRQMQAAKPREQPQVLADTHGRGK